MYAELTRIVGEGEVVSVAPITQLRAGQSDAGNLDSVACAPPPHRVPLLLTASLR
jgi:hypothetical protein